ncbi:MAG: thiamine diphosphokinase [Clostridia bacterium]|nr:thiamine diphosphokinase [Clostridia bacterium]
MKVVIVLGGDAPGKALLARCTADADLTIAADKGLEAFASAGIMPDILLGDMDSVSEDVLARMQSVAEIDRLPCIKDDTDGVHALDVAIARGAKHITLLGALGGRLDHALANLMLLVRAHRSGVPAQILSETVRIERVNGCKRILGAKGDTASVLPLGEAKNVTLKGFFYPLDHAVLHSGYPLGISNVIDRDEATISVEEGDLLLFHHSSIIG